MICNSHEPLATPSIIARVSIIQAWVVVQWCCRFNDSHRWVFPPPITTSLVIGCSVRGRSHFCCGASSTVSFFSSFSALNQTYKLDLGSIPLVSTSLCSSSLLFLNQLCRSLRVSATFALLCHSVLKSFLDLPCNKSMGPSERMINNAQSFLVRCTYALLQRASPNDVITTSFV